MSEALPTREETVIHGGWLSEVLKHFREIAGMPITEQTAWEAVHFARAALAMYDVHKQDTLEAQP